MRFNKHRRGAFFIFKTLKNIYLWFLIVINLIQWLPIGLIGAMIFLVTKWCY